MVSVDGIDITVTKGDSFPLTVTFTGADAPQDGTLVQMTVKDTPRSEEAVIERYLTVDNGAITTEFTHGDTNIPSGNYSWDLRIVTDNDNVNTPMAVGSFKVTEVVGSGQYPT